RVEIGIRGVLDAVPFGVGVQLVAVHPLRVLRFGLLPLDDLQRRVRLAEVILEPDPVGAVEAAQPAAVDLVSPPAQQLRRVLLVAHGVTSRSVTTRKSQSIAYVCWLAHCDGPIV